MDVVTDTPEVEAGAGAADCVYARPADDGRYPGVVLFTDAYGVRKAAREHAERLAGGGYCVLMPNLFYRTGAAPVLEDIERLLWSDDRAGLFPQLRPKMARLTPEAQDADARAWLGFLREQDEVSEGPIGTVGYCMGGRLSLRMAGRFADDVGAAASFHGGNLATDGEDSPHLAAVHATGELYIGHADNDRSMDPEQMGRLTRALAEAHVRHTAELYVGAAHGWTQADTPVYDEPSAERHWMRLLELYARTLA